MNVHTQTHGFQDDTHIRLLLIFIPPIPTASLNLLFLPWWEQYLEDCFEFLTFPSWHEAETEVLPFLVAAIPLTQPSCFSSNGKQAQLLVSYFQPHADPSQNGPVTWISPPPTLVTSSNHKPEVEKKPSRSIFCFVVFGAPPVSSPLDIFFFTTTCQDL